MRTPRGLETSRSEWMLRSDAQHCWPGRWRNPRPPRSSSIAFEPVTHCRPRDDFRVGLALVELYEDDLKDPGRAMAELRRLIDRYPTSQGVRRLRVALASLKSERFGPSENEDAVG